MSTDDEVTTYEVQEGWLVERSKGCTCAGATSGSSLHEGMCGIVPLSPIEDVLRDLARLTLAEHALSVLLAQHGPLRLTPESLALEYTLTSAPTPDGVELTATLNDQPTKGLF